MTTPYPFTPWYVPGWTSQQPYPGYDDILVIGDSNLPAGISKISVVGKYVKLNGVLAGGTVKFRSAQPVYEPVSKTTISPGELTGRILAGNLSMAVPAGFTYQVRELLPGGRNFTVSIPVNSSGTVDINDLRAWSNYGEGTNFAIPFLRTVSVPYSSLVTPNVDATDVLNIGVLTGNIAIASPAGTPGDGQTIRIRFEQDSV